MPRPQPSEHAPYWERYIKLVPEDDIVAAMEAQLADTMPFLRSVPENRARELHPPYTWTIKEVVGHLCDCERIFVYRALRFARSDSTPLAGFEENDYVAAAPFKRISLSRLITEFELSRRAHLAFFGNLDDAAWSRSGQSNNNAMTVRAAAYVIVGHVRHHMAILRNRFAA
ncbi:MAG: DinB family protein [Planctomycetes bacterium]|nr:DinB family protein [Planctomycetota bacterium]